MTSAAFLINQKDAAGTGLDDVKMAHLTDSIEGLFDAEPVLPAAKAKTAADKPVVPAAKVVAKQPLVKAVAATTKPKAADQQPSIVKAAVKPKVAAPVHKSKPVEAVRAVVKPSQPKVIKAIVKPAQPKAVKTVATKSTVVQPVAAPPQAKVVKTVTKLLQPKAVATKPKVVKPVAKPVAKVAKTKVVASAPQPQVVKAVAKAPQPRVVKAATKAPQPKAVKAAATAPKRKAVKAAAKVPQPKVVKAFAKTPVKAAAKAPQPKVVKALAKTPQPKVVKVLAKTPVKATAKTPPKVVKAVTKTAQPKVVKAFAKTPQPKVVKTLVKVPQPKVAKTVTKAVAKVVAKAPQVAVAKLALKPKAVVKATQAAQVAVKAKVAANVVAKAPITKAKAIAPQPKASKPIAKVQVAAKPKQVQVAQVKLMKTASNNSESHAAVNASVNATEQAANKTKEIEAAVVSLPMAGFALDMSVPANKTIVVQKKFPGNASQEAEFHKKEKSLEHEIVSLKKRLAKVNVTAPKPIHPAATGTFNSHLDAGKKISTPPVNLVVSKGPAPMEPIRKEKPVKVTWPSMKSVAAPVDLHRIHAVAAPPQKEAIAVQKGLVKKMDMGTTFTGTPARKVESVMALDTVVVHDAMFTSFADNAAVATPSWWQQSVGFVSSLFAKVFGQHSVEVATEKSKLAHRQAASFIDTTQRRSLKQDMERTAEATREEGLHIVSLSSVWGKMEDEDRVEGDMVRSEDESERQRARTTEKAYTPTAAELKGRHGTEMSSFWGQLEHQDADIEKSVSNEHLDEYRRLMKVQEDIVDKAATQLKDNKLHTDRKDPLNHNDQAFLSKTIHDTWEGLEKNDQALERKIHDNPDLQKLQLKHSWHTLK